MISRCYNEKDWSYKNYGGRGIKVCDRWLNDFETYSQDIKKLGIKPGPGYSLDRINNDGDYEPNNIRWATRSEQAQNRRTTRLITLGNKTQSIKEYEIKRSTFNQRLINGWNIENALIIPIRKKLEKV